LHVGEADEPHAAPDEVRVRVRAAGVSPVDLALRSGASPSAARLALPHIPGVDAAGVVDEVGGDVNTAALGDEIFGAVDVAKLGGATAEFALLKFWAAKPAAMSWEEAAASATSIETATRALDLLGVTPGTTLLIDGATGGVGSVAVQLAIARGATVIGTGHANSQDFIASLGAIPATYGAGLPKRLRDYRVDLALDAAGKGALPELIELTGSPGSVVTIADFGASALGVRLSIGDLGGQPNGRHGLADAAELYRDGRLIIPVEAVFGFSAAADAHTHAERGRRRGKIVLAAE
jgi:NADPH:quinone reductase-like Zn-dependent oxidoreductase